MRLAQARPAPSAAPRLILLPSPQSLSLSLYPSVTHMHNQLCVGRMGNGEQRYELES